MDVKETVATEQPPLGVILSEHDVQLRLLDRIDEALANGGGEEAVTNLLEKFVAYTELHFMSEQLLMDMHDYPERRQHLTEHSQLIGATRTLITVHTSGDSVSTRKCLKMLRDGLEGHVRSRDEQLAAFLESAE